MKLTRTAALIVAALVVGLVAGNVISVSAAPSSDSTVAAGAGMGLRLGAAMRDAGGRLADIVAKLTGQDVDEVKEQREAGKSFGDIAGVQGVTSAEVVEEALKVRAQILAERVEVGAITQDQADAALDRMETRLTDRVSSTDAGCNGAGSGMGGGGRGGRGGMGGGGCGMGGGGACGGACTQDPAAAQ